MHILVVEDERILCETIARSLKRLAYSVDCCYDGITAMQMLADDNFDLVVLDLNLPGADGMTVLRTLRKTDRDTKVLILSARSEVSDKVDGLVWMQVQTIIWQSRSIWKNLLQGFAVLPSDSSLKMMLC